MKQCRFCITRFYDHARHNYEEYLYYNNSDKALEQNYFCQVRPYLCVTLNKASAQKEDNTHNNNASLDDVFMSKDDAVNALDGNIDHELVEFKTFCLMTKPIEICHKVNLKDLAMKKPYLCGRQQAFCPSLGQLQKFSYICVLL